MLGLFFNRKKAARITAPKGVVMRTNHDLLTQRGWSRSKSGKGWVGPFATRYGTYPGHIEPTGDTFDVYVRDPPDGMRRHHKWVCFHVREHNWHRIHLAVPPADRDPNSIIRYVEQILTEAHRL